MEKSLGDRLRDLRGELSQANFARKIRSPQTTYSSWERNYKEPSLSTLRYISSTFGVSTDWLLGLSDDRRGVVVSIPNEEYEAKIADLQAKITDLEVKLTSSEAQNEAFRLAFAAIGKGK